MDNQPHTKQLPHNYKSPRIPKQTHHHDENILRKSAVLSNDLESPVKKVQPQNSLRGSTDLSKAQSTGFNPLSKAMTPKVLNSLSNQVHLHDSSKKLKTKENGSLPQIFDDEKIKRAGSFDKGSLEDIDHLDEIRLTKGGNGDVENLRHSVVQGSKLPMINNKRVMPRNETKKLVRRNGLDRQANYKGDFELTSNTLNISNKVMHSNSSPTKQIGSSRPRFGFEDKEEDLNTSLGKLYFDDKRKPQAETKGLQAYGVEGTTTVIRKRYASGCARTLQSTMSGGEEEDTPKDNLSFSLSIAPVKGAQRTVKQIKKKGEAMMKERRASSPEGKNRSLDLIELKAMGLKETDKVIGKGKKYKEEEKFLASFSGRKEGKRDTGDSEDEVEVERNVSKELGNEGDEELEQKKIEWRENEMGDFTKKVMEREIEREIAVENKEVEVDKGKTKMKEKVQVTLKKLGVTSPGGKEVKEGTPKGDMITAVVARANKRLQSHLQASKMMEREKDMIQWKREQAYKEFMLRMNFSFNVQVRVPTEKTFTAYKYYLGKGNNSMMLKSMMKQRWWWVQIDNKDAADINFLWTQLKQNKFMENLKQKRKTPFESLEGSGVFSSYCSNNETSANSLTSIDSNTDNESENGDSEVKSAGKTKKRSKSKKMTGGKLKKKEEQKQEDTVTAGLKKLFTSNEIMLMNTLADSKGNMPLNPEEYEEIGKMKKVPAPQVVGNPSGMKMCNHLESNFHLANKKALLWNMRSYYEAIKENVFDHLPLTFHVRNGFEDKEYKNFLEYYNNREKEIQEQEKEAKKNAKKLKNIWIVKPGENTNRGIGIHVCNELSQINELVATTEGNYNGKKRTYLIQQYIEKPLLYNKRKFDIRCYILMTCINGTMKGYWYQEGYIRTATKEFSLKNVTNKLVHLTNDAVQKKAEDYGKFEAGNKLSYADFQKYLDQHYNGTINFNNDIYPKIRQLAIDSIKAVYGKIDPYRRENSFEIFGLDFMVDTDLNAWLIEVNTNPDINASSPALTRVIPNMVENALRLTIDQMYPPPAWQISKKLLLPENLLENNKFELVFDEVEDGPALRSILQPDKGATGDLILEIVAEEEEEDAEEEAKD